MFFLSRSPARHAVTVVSGVVCVAAGNAFWCGNRCFMGLTHLFQRCSVRCVSTIKTLNPEYRGSRVLSPSHGFVGDMLSCCPAKSFVAGVGRRIYFATKKTDFFLEIARPPRRNERITYELALLNAHAVGPLSPFATPSRHCLEGGVTDTPHSDLRPNGVNVLLSGCTLATLLLPEEKVTARCLRVPNPQSD